jgi:hypothetical protein
MNLQSKEVILLLSIIGFWIVVGWVGFYIYRKMRDYNSYRKNITVTEIKARHEPQDQENLKQNTSSEMSQRLNNFEKRITHLEKKGSS